MCKPGDHGRVDCTESLLHVLQELLPVELIKWPSNHSLVEVGLSDRPDLLDRCTQKNMVNRIERMERMERMDQDRMGQHMMDQDGFAQHGKQQVRHSRVDQSGQGGVMIIFGKWFKRAVFIFVFFSLLYSLEWVSSEDGINRILGGKVFM